MGNIASGLALLLLVVIITLLTAFIQNGSTDTIGTANCGPGDNFTTCEAASKSNFLADIVDVAFTGIDGAPIIFNVLYVLVVGACYIIGLILFSFGVVGVINGSGA